MCEINTGNSRDNPRLRRGPVQLTDQDKRAIARDKQQREQRNIASGLPADFQGDYVKKLEEITSPFQNSRSWTRPPKPSALADNKPPVPPDATDEAIREADKLRRRELQTARRSLSNSFLSGRGSVLGGK